MVQKDFKYGPLKISLHFDKMISLGIGIIFNTGGAYFFGAFGPFAFYISVGKEA